MENGPKRYYMSAIMAFIDPDCCPCGMEDCKFFLIHMHICMMYMPHARKRLAKLNEESMVVPGCIHFAPISELQPYMEVTKAYLKPFSAYLDLMKLFRRFPNYGVSITIVMDDYTLSAFMMRLDSANAFAIAKIDPTKYPFLRPATNTSFLINCGDHLEQVFNHPFSVQSNCFSTEGNIVPISGCIAQRKRKLFTES